MYSIIRVIISVAKLQFLYQIMVTGAIAEYPARREQKSHAPAGPQWPKKVKQLS